MSEPKHEPQAPEEPRPESASPVAGVVREPTLHELYARHDLVWRAFVATPLEERREWSQKGYAGDSEACRLYQELQSLNEQIGPRQRLFEPVLSEVFGTPDDELAVEIYRALSNIDWEHEDGSRYSCTWRYAGGLVAHLRGRGEDYLDFYCSGGEGRVSERVAAALAAHGWHPRADDDDLYD